MLDEEEGAPGTGGRRPIKCEWLPASRMRDSTKLLGLRKRARRGVARPLERGTDGEAGRSVRVERLYDFVLASRKEQSRWTRRR